MPAQGSQRDARLAIALARFFYLKELQVKLTVNGEAYEAKEPVSVTALLEEMGIGGRAVVVVLNDEVIPASARGTTGQPGSDRLFWPAPERRSDPGARDPDQRLPG